MIQKFQFAFQILNSPLNPTASSNLPLTAQAHLTASGIRPIKGSSSSSSSQTRDNVHFTFCASLLSFSSLVFSGTRVFQRRCVRFFTSREGNAGTRSERSSGRWCARSTGLIPRGGTRGTTSCNWSE